MILRPYQRETIDRLYGWFRTNPEGNPLAVLPTGAGKSVVIGTLIREAIENWPQTRILVVTHVKELIEQNAAKLAAIWPEAPMGIYSAGLRRKDTHSPIIFAGIQSIWKKTMHLGWFDLILVDECHLISHKAQGTYRNFLDAERAINPHVRVIGFTATPFRTGFGSIAEGDDRIFHDVAHEVSMLDLIQAGYLSPLISKRMATQIDLSAVQTRQGEFVASQLERAVDRENITTAAINECLSYGADRKKWLVFCAGVDHAQHVAAALTAQGISTGCVVGTTPAQERDALIGAFREGKLRALTNANVLTTGFDVPDTDMLVMLRPTLSPGLFVQMIGRGSRIAPGKDNCLVLDFAGNVLRHGPVDQIRAWSPRAGVPSAAPTKTCPKCETICAAATRTCPDCGHVFPINEDPVPAHAASAADAPITSDQEAVASVQRFRVASVRYQRWPGKANKPDSMRVDYYGGLNRIASEWICLEHPGYASAKAFRWWLARAPEATVPCTIADALERTGELRTPAAIHVQTQTKYPEIVSYEWTHDAEQEGRDPERATDPAKSCREHAREPQLQTLRQL